MTDRGLEGVEGFPILGCPPEPGEGDGQAGTTMVAQGHGGGSRMLVVASEANGAIGACKGGPPTSRAAQRNVPKTRTEQF